MSPQDKLYERFKDKFNGRFVEFGANNGIDQSYTYKLAKDNGWKGVLVEPSYCLIDQLTLNRPESEIVLGAISNYDGVISGNFNGSMMSSVNGDRKLSNDLNSVSCWKLTTLLTKLNFTDIDLCSIDTEGHELECVDGIDFAVLNIKSFIIELYTHNVNWVTSRLAMVGYKRECLTNFNHETHPMWDGLHQDYFFFKDE